jgi:hypothetical protein
VGKLDLFAWLRMTTKCNHWKLLLQLFWSCTGTWTWTLTGAIRTRTLVPLGPIPTRTLILPEPTRTRVLILPGPIRTHTLIPPRPTRTRSPLGPLKCLSLWLNQYSGSWEATWWSVAAGTSVITQLRTRYCVEPLPQNLHWQFLRNDSSSSDDVTVRCLCL